MLFENFEQTESENKRLALFIFLGVLLVPLGFILGFQFLLGMRNESSQLHHTIGTDDAQLRRVHELCTALPRPEKLEFISSEENADFQSATVIYSYNSPRGADEIMPTYLVWLNDNDWHRIPNTSTYKKGNQTIYISPQFVFGNPLMNYEIHCTEKD